MEFFKKVWQWLDGNKTKLGTLMIALVASGLIGEHTLVYQILAWLGPILAGVGILHMAAKGTANTGKESYK